LLPDFVSLWNVFAEDTVKMRAGALFSSAISGGQDSWRSGWEKIFADFLPTAGEKRPKRRMVRALCGKGADRDRNPDREQGFCSNMERKKLTCVSYQNKKAKDFLFPAGPTVIALLRYVPFRPRFRPARITPGLIMSTCALI
jgi:hypothetical protein